MALSDAMLKDSSSSGSEGIDRGHFADYDAVPTTASRNRGATRPSFFQWVVLSMGIVGGILGAIALGIASGTRDDLQSLGSVQRVIAGRLLPGADVIPGLMGFVQSHGLQSAWIVSAVGSLTQFNIRYANQPDGTIGNGHFEIVSLVGTMTKWPPTTNPTQTLGAWHIHISVGDELGRTYSGHLLRNSTIYTTLEFVIGYNCNIVFTRAIDGSTPWDELQISHQKWC